ncbi:helix-turn-helix domain-containing protein [Streptomyces uncialis]|uniref:helix-turn-helix domain-containing protein n=2 Tax=Streptomyces TaxID=1883 RepID=UPI00386A5946|nr:helix-turn-helix domain-containing protein [Streptomyces uncialis]
MPDQEERVGARIASNRKLAGYTQNGLAAEAHVSLGAIRKVERGERLPTHGLLIAVARALRVTVEELTGQPYKGEKPSDRRTHAPVQGIRTAVRRHDLPVDWYTAPRPVHELAGDVRTAAGHRAAARYSMLGAMLPGLLEELTAGVHLTSGKRQQAHARLLASTYYMSHGLAYRLGYSDLIGQLEDRMRWAAGLSRDPLMRALAEWTRSYSFDMFGDYEGGLRVLGAARAELESESPEGGSERITMLGSLHLRESTFASLARDHEGTEHHINEARKLSERVPGGRDRLHYHMTFGPANVAVHDVAASVELKRPEEAVRKAKGLRFPVDMARTRQGHHHVAVARAYVDLDRREGALKHLRRARSVAPELTRFHPTARETARLLTHKYRRSTEELRSMTTWFGVQP